MNLQDKKISIGANLGTKQIVIFARSIVIAKFIGKAVTRSD